MATGFNIGKLASNISNILNTQRSRLSIAHEIPEIYKPRIGHAAQKIIDNLKDKAEVASKSELARKLRVAKEYYRVEMSVPGMDEQKRLKEDLILAKDFMKSGCYKYLTVKQAWLLFLVGLEICLWFFLGETFGKFHIVGYKV